MRKSRLNRFLFFDYINVFMLLCAGIVTFYPFYNVLLMSLNDPTDSSMGGLFLFVRKFTLLNYYQFFKDSLLLRAFFISVGRTVIGTFCSVLFTSAFAFGISKSYLIGRKFVVGFMLLTMYISGGLVPYFILIKSVGLYHNFLVYVIPALFSSYNAIILMTAFKQIPHEIEESVRIDGGNDITIFFRVVIPISMPVIATIALFNAVGQWNAWFDSILLGGRELMTLQAKLVEVITDANQARELERAGQNIIAGILQQHYKPTVESIKATAMMVTAIPIIAVYPFLQKYFVKGIMIGSLKG